MLIHPLTFISLHSGPVQPHNLMAAINVLGFWLWTHTIKEAEGIGCHGRAPQHKSSKAFVLQKKSKNFYSLAAELLHIIYKVWLEYGLLEWNV